MRIIAILVLAGICYGQDFSGTYVQDVEIGTLGQSRIIVISAENIEITSHNDVGKGIQGIRTTHKYTANNNTITTEDKQTFAIIFLNNKNLQDVVIMNPQGRANWDNGILDLQNVWIRFDLTKGIRPSLEGIVQLYGINCRVRR